VWTTTRFAQAGQGLWDEYGMKVIIVGSRSDYDQGESIRAQMRAPAVNLAGLTSTAQLAALLKQCSLTVAVDSGPMHVAAAMGTPVVALFGPTDPELTGPHGEQHVVVRGAPRPARGTMQRITPQAVLSAVGKIMSASRQPDLVA
jgi:ADP-heptose:LPS heptosyltransferase